MIQQQRKIQEENSIANLVKSVIYPDATPAKTEEVKVESKYIEIDDFAKVEIRVGTILYAEIVEKSDKLYKLSVDFGEEKPRQVLSGIRKFVNAEDLIGKQFPFVTNLAPRAMMGMESQAMILAASEGETLALFNPSQKISNGIKLR